VKVSAVSESAAPDATDRTWRRTRTLVAVLTFWGIVLVLFAVNDGPGSRAVTVTLPLVAALLGGVVSLVRRGSPVGSGLLRGAAMVCLLYASGLVLVLLSVVG
jgi:hypothetical protein